MIRPLNENEIIKCTEQLVYIDDGIDHISDIIKSKEPISVEDIILEAYPLLDNDTTKFISLMYSQMCYQINHKSKIGNTIIDYSFCNPVNFTTWIMPFLPMCKERYSNLSNHSIDFIVDNYLASPTRAGNSFTPDSCLLLPAKLAAAVAPWYSKYHIRKSNGDLRIFNLSDNAIDHNKSYRNNTKGIALAIARLLKYKLWYIRRVYFEEGFCNGFSSSNYNLNELHPSPYGNIRIFNYIKALHYGAVNSDGTSLYNRINFDYDLYYGRELLKELKHEDFDEIMKMVNEELNKI